MASPSPAAVAAIKSKVSDWSPTDAQIASALNSPSVANPAAQGQVPKPFSMADLVNAAGTAARPALGSFVAPASALVIAQDAAHLAAGIDALAALGSINATDATAMKAVLSATTPDPAWAAQVSWAQATLGRPVDAADVAASR